MQTSTQHIRPARASELTALQSIERSAGLAFADYGMAEISAHDPPSVQELLAYVQANHLWVYAPESAGPVAYMMIDIVDDCVHLEQISVQADYAGYKIGWTLIDWLAVWASAKDYGAITLTTFRDVPWNAPYYQRCGFQILSDSLLGKELLAIRQHETVVGLDKWPRVCMRRPLRN